MGPSGPAPSLTDEEADVQSKDIKSARVRAGTGTQTPPSLPGLTLTVHRGTGDYRQKIRRTEGKGKGQRGVREVTPATWPPGETSHLDAFRLRPRIWTPCPTLKPDLVVLPSSYPSPVEDPGTGRPRCHGVEVKSGLWQGMTWD